MAISVQVPVKFLTFLFICQPLDSDLSDDFLRIVGTEALSQLFAAREVGVNCAFWSQITIVYNVMPT